MDDLHIFPLKLSVSTYKRETEGEREKKQRERNRERFRKNTYNASLKEQFMRNQEEIQEKSL